MLLGAALRLAPFVLDRSLWLDEAKLALNVLDRSPAELFRPLDYDQAAPVGFLLLEKEAVTLLGGGERALRLVPLLAGLASLVLFPAVARRWLAPAEALLALALFALSTPLVYYATEVKQYSTDVFTALALLWAAVRVLESRTGALLLLLVAGAVGVWLSHPAVFVAAGLGSTLVVSAWRRGDRPAAARLAAVAAAAGVSFLAHYFLVLSRSDPKGYLVHFWADGFPALVPRSLADLMWWVETPLGFFTDPAGLRFAGLAAAAFALGAWRFWRSDRRALGLLVAPFLFTLLAAVLHRYPFPTGDTPGTVPFAGRPILFLVPAAFILAASGIGWVARGPDRDRAVIGGVMAAVLLAGLAAEAVRRPAYGIRPHEVRPLVEALAQDSRAGDLAVINTRAMPVFNYYARRLGDGGQVVRDLPVTELPGTNRWDAYEARIEALPAGARVWVLYTHHPSWRSQQDEAFVLYALDRRGQRRREIRTPGASLHLYRLGPAAGRDAAAPAAPAPPLPVK